MYFFGGLGCQKEIEIAYEINAEKKLIIFFITHLNGKWYEYFPKVILFSLKFEFWPQIYALVAIRLKYWWWQPGLVIFFFYTKPSFTKNTAKESKHIWNTWKMRIVMYLYSRLIAKPTGLSITALLIVSSICLSADQKWIDYF